MRKSRFSEEQIIGVLKEHQEEENRNLKKLLAEQMLDAATLREMLAKNF